MAKEKSNLEYEQIITRLEKIIENQKLEKENQGKIMAYQENLINKLLNTLQNKELQVRNDIERGNF